MLTVLIVFLFLASWRSTVITGLTLPISMIGTFLFIYAFGFTINLLTLMALSLCDRPADRRCDRGARKHRAPCRHARKAPRHRRRRWKAPHEIGLAVLATTLSIVAVFLPVGFMGGIIGRFFYQFGVTVAAGGADLDVRVVHARPDARRRSGTTRWSMATAQRRGGSPPSVAYWTSSNGSCGGYPTPTVSAGLGAAASAVDAGDRAAHFHRQPGDPGGRPDRLRIHSGRPITRRPG